MQQELEQAEYYSEMNKVVEALLKGETNVTKLARSVGLSRVKVLDYIEAWKEIARNDDGIKDRAKEALTNMDNHYNMIIKEMWNIVEDASIDAKTRSSTLKQIADIESKRQETLQKAGLYDDADIAGELVETQIKAEAIKELLRLVATKFPETREEILSGLGKIFNENLSVDNTIIVMGALPQ